MINRKLKKNNKKGHEIEPDEIFADSQNFPGFNTHRLEGRLEKPIAKSIVLFLSISFLIIGSIFLWRLNFLQITKGEAYYELAENNRLSKEPIFAERGIIYDRNLVELVWNEEGVEEVFPRRTYIELGGFSHILGYVSLPSQDKSGFYWQDTFVGKDGMEKQFNELLSGKNGWKIVEVNSAGDIQSENIIEFSEAGENITLSIDSRVQNKLFDLIAENARRGSFEGGVGIIMNVENGEILSLANYPEYDSMVLTIGNDNETIETYRSDSGKPFLNRAVSGLYTPGSTVKPFLALGALNEGVITPDKKILSTGSISIPNPWDKTKESIFKDWKAHGWVNMISALAVSSNVYFYEIGGGYENQKGIGISGIKKYMNLFGFEDKTGIDLAGEKIGLIPTPEWKQKTFKNDPWRLGDTYNTAIGQYGFQVTPIQMTRAIATVANYGKLLTPHLILPSNGNNVDLYTKRQSQTISPQINIEKDTFETIHEGLRRAVTNGTAAKLKYVPVKAAAKTGTAQVGPKKRYQNSWVIGFFPYESPRFAFTILMERGPVKSGFTATDVARDLLTWMGESTPEYLTNN